MEQQQLEQLSHEPSHLAQPVSNSIHVFLYRPVGLPDSQGSWADGRCHCGDTAGLQVVEWWVWWGMRSWNLHEGDSKCIGKMFVRIHYIQTFSHIFFPLHVAWSCATSYLVRLRIPNLKLRSALRAVRALQIRLQWHQVHLWPLPLPALVKLLNPEWNRKPPKLKHLRNKRLQKTRTKPYMQVWIHASLSDWYNMSPGYANTII